jgi:hypothetical protein
VTFLTTCDATNWVVAGAAGLNTGTVSLNGDLLLSDEVPEASGGEAAIVMLNQDVVFTDTEVTTAITHDVNNGGGVLARCGGDLSGASGYAFVIDGKLGIAVEKKIEINVTTRLSSVEIPDYSPSNTYELKFSVIGDTLTGRVFHNGLQVASVVATDDTFASGHVGIVGTTTVGQVESPVPSTSPLRVKFGDLTASVPAPIPTVSQWGLIVMAGLVLAAGAVVIVWRKRRLAV